MKHVFLLLGLLLGATACSAQRPAGPEAKQVLNVFNRASRPVPDGNARELYHLLSTDAIAQLTEEIEKARTLDSAAVAALPRMEMLRVLVWKNTLAEKLRKTEDLEFLIPHWFDAATKGFPLNDNSSFVYTPDVSLETQMLTEGLLRPQVLLVEENGRIKVNPFNTPEYQERRLELILQTKDWDTLVGEAAWLYFQPYRPVNWDKL
jgi:hypothetical protein